MSTEQSRVCGVCEARLLPGDEVVQVCTVTAGNFWPAYKYAHLHCMNPAKKESSDVPI